MCDDYYPAGPDGDDDDYGPDLELEDPDENDFEAADIELDIEYDDDGNRIPDNDVELFIREWDCPEDWLDDDDLDYFEKLS